MRAVSLAGCVLAVVALLGLLVACTPRRACVHRPAAALYFITSLPSCAALLFVSLYCLAFRTDAEQIAQTYWRCLHSAGGEAGGLQPTHSDERQWHSVGDKVGAQMGESALQAAAAVYQRVTLAAALLLGSALLLLLAVFSAARVVGPRT